MNSPLIVELTVGDSTRTRSVGVETVISSVSPPICSVVVMFAGWLPRRRTSVCVIFLKPDISTVTV